MVFLMSSRERCGFCGAIFSRNEFPEHCPAREVPLPHCLGNNYIPITKEELDAGIASLKRKKENKIVELGKGLHPKD